MILRIQEGLEMFVWCQNSAGALRCGTSANHPKRTGLNADIFVCEASPGAQQLYTA